jgi:hypothetical protein
MSVDQDNATPDMPADEEFAALMAASSLRAPRVRAMDEAIPGAVRRQLHTASASASVADTEPAADPDTVHSAPPQEHAEIAHITGTAGIVLLTGLLGAFSEDSRRGHRAALGERRDQDRADRVREVGSWRAVASLLTGWTPSWPPAHQVDRRLRDLRDEGWTIRPTTYLRASGQGSGRLKSALERQHGVDCQFGLVVYSRSEIDGMTAAPYGEESNWLRRHTTALNGLLQRGRCGWPALGTAVCLLPTRAAGRPSQAPNPLFLTCRQAASAWDSQKAGRAFNAMPSQPAHLIWAAGDGTDGPKRATYPVELPRCQQELWPGLACPGRCGHTATGQPRRSPEQSAPWLPPACVAVPPVDGAGLLAAAGFLFVQRSAPVPLVHSPETPALPTGLLVAADRAVDLDLAYRHDMPHQPAGMPDLDSYAPRPGGGVLLMPRTIPAEHARLTDAPPGTVASTAGGSCRLWRSEDGDAFEQHARLWMRHHRSEDDPGQCLPAELVYRTTDPYAVTAVFNCGSEEETRWFFARELLKDGLHSEAGIGDVVVWPSSAQGQEADRVFVRLRSPEGTALLSAARDDIEAFLGASQPLARNPLAFAQRNLADAWERELNKIICRRISD